MALQRRVRRTGPTARDRSGRTTAEVEAAFASRIPLHRLADPDEIARVAVFPASPAGSYVDGALFVVDGGQTRTPW